MRTDSGGPGRVLRRVRRAVHERLARPGTVPVDVAALVAPLRYDVVVRARLFDLLAEHAGAPEDVLVEAASHSGYATWFEHVECARYFPELLADPERREQRFAARVRGAAALLRSVEERGIDPSHPVTLITAAEGTGSESGAPALGGLHIGDGCHRLALLLRSGATLEPWMYKVRPSLGPLVDNTTVLAGRGALTESEYVRFLGARFPVGAARTVARALETVEAVDAQAVPTLRAVTAAQWPTGSVAG